MQGASLTLQIIWDSILGYSLLNTALYFLSEYCGYSSWMVSFSNVHIEDKLLILRSYPWRFL